MDLHSPHPRPWRARFAALALTSSITVLVGPGRIASAAPGPTTSTVPSPASTVAGPTTTTTSTTTPPGSSTTTGAPSITPQTAPTPATVPPAGAPISSLRLDQVDAQFLTAVQAEVGSAEQGLALAQGGEAHAAGIDQSAATALIQDTQRLSDLTASQRRAAASVVEARAHLKSFAVAAYESGGPGAPVAALLSAQSIGDFGRRQAYFTTVATATADALRNYLRAREATTRATLAAVDDVQKAQASKAGADQALLVAQASVQQAAATLVERRALLTLASDAVSTPSTDVPRMVLDAYQRAAASVEARGCQLSWWALAGIGKVESDQGRAEHAQLTPTGELVPHIVGVPLTGQNGTALIVDPTGAYAHAEGPLQFIPSTWARWGRDGNADGVKDPDNIYDAAVAAADYLCATSTSLQGDAGLTAAYLSYNDSSDYAAEVLAYARSYEAADVEGLIPTMSPVPLYTLAPPAAGGSAPGA